MGASLALTTSPCLSAAHDASQTVKVRISRFAFVPEMVEINAGDTVVWINEDIAPHTATAQDDGWDTATIETGETAWLVFETPGSFDYVCAFHPHMTGTVTVRPRQSG